MIHTFENDQQPGSTRLRIAIADDHPIVRNGLKIELAQHAGIEIVGEAGDGDAALQLVQTRKPDLLLLDIKMPGMKSMLLLRALARLPRPPRVLILSAYGDLEYVLTMLKTGATGYLLKDEDPVTIIEGVRAVARGETWLSPRVAAALVSHSLQGTTTADAALTPREKEVLVLIARGHDNRQIVENLSLSEGTVKNHITNIYDKLGIRSRAEAVAWAWEHGLVQRQL